MLSSWSCCTGMLRSTIDGYHVCFIVNNPSLPPPPLPPFSLPVNALPAIDGNPRSLVSDANSAGVPDPHPSVLRDLARRCVVSGLQRKISRQVLLCAYCCVVPGAVYCGSNPGGWKILMFFFFFLSLPSVVEFFSSAQMRY